MEWTGGLHEMHFCSIIQTGCKSQSVGLKNGNVRLEKLPQMNNGVSS